MNSWAVIFDMDGVIVDTNPFHDISWRAFFKTHGLTISEEEFRKNAYGRINTDIVRYLLGSDLPMDQLKALGDQKEELFRQYAAGQLQPLAGLKDLLLALEAKGIVCAVATSAPKENVDFVMAETGLRRFFSVIVDESFVQRGKPAPDIYLTAARKVDMQPERCLVFEDSISGVKSGQNAGMTVVGLSTTHDPSELAPYTALVLPDFREVASAAGVDKLQELVYQTKGLN